MFLFSPHSFVYNLPLFFPRFLRSRTCALRLTAVLGGGRVGVVYAAVQDGYLVFPLNVVQRCFRGYLVTNTS